MTTFRDLAVAADRHLIAAASYGGALSQVDAARVAGELAILSRICRRVLDDVIDGHPEPAADALAKDRAVEGAAWRAAANAAFGDFQAVERQLERAIAAYGPKDDTVPARVAGFSPPLRSAIKKLGLAEQVLQTELTSGVPGSRRPVFRDPDGLGDPETVREITALAGRWIGLVGEVCDRVAKQVRVTQLHSRVDAKPIAQILQLAATYARNAHREIAGATGPATQLSERLALLPRVHTNAELRTARGAELVRRLLELAEEEAAALRKSLNVGDPRPGSRPGPDGRRTRKRQPVSARSLRYVATSAFMVHTAAAIIARQLAARVAELTGSTDTMLSRSLANAADALIDSSRAWNTTARGWDHVLTSDVSLSSAATHATSTVMRLGNAAYADPDWTPASPNTTVRSATEFAADLDDVWDATAHLERIVAAYTGAARASIRTIRTLHGRKALFTELGDKPVCAQPGDTAPLRGTYDTVLDHAATARQWLRIAQTATECDSTHAPALAAADFPDQPLARPEPTAHTTPAPAPGSTARATATAPPAGSAAASITAPTPMPAPMPAPAAAVRPARRTR